jgi:hypothetical protein
MLRSIVTLGALFASLTGAQAAPPQLYVYVADHQASQLYVVTHKAGLLSFLGHEHAIVPMAWHADLCLADPIPDGAHATLVVPTDSLVIDSDSARTLAGLGRTPPRDERRQVQDKMLDAKHLDAARFPDVRLDLRAVGALANGKLTVQGTLRLHGVTRSVKLPVGVRHGDAGRLVLSGTLRIGQRDFGIQPEAVAGVVKVANEVDLHILLAVRPTARVCGGT